MPITAVFIFRYYKATVYIQGVDRYRGTDPIQLNYSSVLFIPSLKKTYPCRFYSGFYIQRKHRIVELELEFFSLEWLNKFRRCRESTSDVSTKLYCYSTLASRSFVKYSNTVRQRVLKSFLFRLFNFGHVQEYLLMLHCFVNNPKMLS